MSMHCLQLPIFSLTKYASLHKKDAKPMTTLQTQGQRNEVTKKKNGKVE